MLSQRLILDECDIVSARGDLPGDWGVDLSEPWLLQAGSLVVNFIYTLNKSEGQSRNTLKRTSHRNSITVSDLGNRFSAALASMFLKLYRQLLRIKTSSYPLPDTIHNSFYLFLIRISTSQFTYYSRNGTKGIQLLLATPVCISW